MGIPKLPTFRLRVTGPLIKPSISCACHCTAELSADFCTRPMREQRGKPFTKSISGACCYKHGMPFRCTGIRYRKSWNKRLVFQRTMVIWFRSFKIDRFKTLHWNWLVTSNCFATNKSFVFFAANQLYLLPGWITYARRKTKHPTVLYWLIMIFFKPMQRLFRRQDKWLWSLGKSHAQHFFV